LIFSPRPAQPRWGHAPPACGWGPVVSREVTRKARSRLSSRCHRRSSAPSPDRAPAGKTAIHTVAAFSFFLLHRDLPGIAAGPFRLTATIKLRPCARNTHAASGRCVFQIENCWQTPRSFPKSGKQRRRVEIWDCNAARARRRRTGFSFLAYSRAYAPDLPPAAALAALAAGSATTGSEPVLSSLNSGWGANVAGGSCSYLITSEGL
jgi:hypothetical protein